MDHRGAVNGNEADAFPPMAPAALLARCELRRIKRGFKRHRRAGKREAEDAS